MSESQSLATRPHPKNQALVPVDVRFGFGMAAFLSLVAFLGVLRWAFPGVVLSTGRDAAYFDLVLFTAPFWCVPAALYFIWRTWRGWRDTRLFNANHQTGPGTVIDLWIEQPEDGSQTRIYQVGYKYADGAEAYQAVTSKRYNRLSVGDAVTVEFVPGRADLSRLADATPRGRRKSKQADAEEDSD